MLRRILGTLDLVAALAFLLNTWFDNPQINWFPDKIVLVLAVYLIIKGIFFLVSMDFASIIDIICGIIIIIGLYLPLGLILSTIIFIFLLQKAIFSFIS